MDQTITELWPVPGRQQTLQGLYLRHTQARIPATLFYTNFVVSLDGRIAVRDPELGLSGVPKSIANGRDWRLFQELATQADAIIVSGRYVRELDEGTAQDSAPISSDEAYADLHTWRNEHYSTNQPTIVIMSGSLKLPGLAVLLAAGRRVLIATSEAAPVQRIAELNALSGVEVMIVGAKYVEGKRLRDALHERQLTRIYAMAGPKVFATLAEADVLDRLYLTTVPRLLGGSDYDTIYEGGALSPPRNFAMQAMFNDEHLGPEPAEQQQFAIYGRSRE